MKTTEKLEPSDLEKSPMWQYADWDSTLVEPVRDLPVGSLENRLVGTKVELNNGTHRWAILSRISLNNLRQTQEFLTIWIEEGGQWFELARYHDVDHETRGARQLAQFLGLSLDQVFPIHYDISQVALGDPLVLAGVVLSEPVRRLSDEERIDLAMEDE